jgi:hypothetical protein
MTSTTPSCESVVQEFLVLLESVFPCLGRSNHLKELERGPAGFTDRYKKIRLSRGRKMGFIMHGPEKERKLSNR